MGIFTLRRSHGEHITLVQSFLFFVNFLSEWQSRSEFPMNVNIFIAIKSLPGRVITKWSIINFPAGTELNLNKGRKYIYYICQILTFLFILNYTNIGAQLGHFNRVKDLAIYLLIYYTELQPCCSSKYC